MTSPDRTRTVVGAFAVLLSLALASELAIAEGTFFKKRRATEVPVRAATPAPTPPSVPAPRVVDESGAASSGAPTAAGREAPGGDASTPLPSPSPAPPPEGVPPVTAANVTGVVEQVPSTDMLVVGGRQLRLAGVSGETSMAAGLQDWLGSQGGQVRCTPAAGNRYRCVTSSNADVGYVVLFNGAGRADGSASPEYRQAEAEARAAGKGVWAR